MVKHWITLNNKDDAFYTHAARYLRCPPEKLIAGVLHDMILHLSTGADVAELKNLCQFFHYCQEKEPLK